MISNSHSAIFDHLIHLKQKQFTGQIEIEGSGRTVWKIYLCLGRLAWTSGGIHPYRSWRRSLDRFCPQIDWHTCNIDFASSGDFGDYHVLTILLKRKLIAREQAIELIKARATEILFDLIQLEDKQVLRINSAPASSSSFLKSGLQMSISLVDVQQVFDDANRLWSIWKQQGLGKCSPNLAPAMRKQDRLREEVSGIVYQNFLRLLDGQRTLRDLSWQMRKDVRKLTYSLVPYVKQNLLEIIEVPDISPPQNSQKSRSIQELENSDRPLVACIDDSPQICKVMEEIVTRQGYRCVSIHEPLQALPCLIKFDPDLVFLDIGMPIVNGYEICTQIKRVNQLKDLPIVFLTGNDGIIDRVRAKVAGVSAFVSKPIDIDKINEVINKYLRPRSISTELTSSAKSELTRQGDRD